jgi:hypothetical protein
MLIALAIAGAVWGGWLGRREVAHIGVGLGRYGLAGGILAGALIGVGVAALPLGWALFASGAVAAITVVLVLDF